MTKSTGVAGVPLADLAPPPPLKLDFGCGPRPREGFDGVDAIDFGQKYTIDLRGPWPWAAEEVAEAFASHFIEHLAGGGEREHFFNELYRILEWDAKATIIAPHWSNDCAYGDPSHKWPPLCNWSHLYWNKTWRDVNAPHTAYTCDFDVTVVTWSLDGAMETRNNEYRGFAVNHYRNAARDIVFHLVKTRR